MKVRVWHKEFKKFLSKEEYCLDLDGKLIFVETAQDDYVKLLAVPPHLYEIQRNTELKDKNGKEIYEGDIARCEDFFGFIEYNKYNACFRIISEKGTLGYDMNRCHNGIILKVIGNIFENQELFAKNGIYSS